MQRAGNAVEIGMTRGEFNDPHEAPEEIKAINRVMGGVDEGLGQLVSAAREACPNPNCCLTAEASRDSAEGGVWDEHPMNDTTYEVDFTRVEIGAKRLIDCAKRGEQLTDAVASMVERCVDATGEADAAGKEKTDAAGKKAKRATSTTAVKKLKKLSMQLKKKPKQ